MQISFRSFIQAERPQTYSKPVCDNVYNKIFQLVTCPHRPCCPQPTDTGRWLSGRPTQPAPGD